MNFSPPTQQVGQTVSFNRFFPWAVALLMVIKGNAETLVLNLFGYLDDGKGYLYYNQAMIYKS